MSLLRGTSSQESIRHRSVTKRVRARRAPEPRVRPAFRSLRNARLAQEHDLVGTAERTNAHVQCRRSSTVIPLQGTGSLCAWLCDQRSPFLSGEAWSSASRSEDDSRRPRSGSARDSTRISADSTAGGQLRRDPAARSREEPRSRRSGVRSPSSPHPRSRRSTRSARPRTSPARPCARPPSRRVSRRRGDRATPG
jgi:hypothetical protein